MCFESLVQPTSNFRTNNKRIKTESKKYRNDCMKKRKNVWEEKSIVIKKVRNNQKNETQKNKDERIIEEKTKC